MAAPSIALAAGGSILSGMGAKASSNATANMYGYQAAVSSMNQQLALQNRDWALQAGGAQAVQYGLKARAQAGDIKVAQGASGIDIGSDSSVNVRESQKEITAIDTNTINTNTARQAYGFTVQAAEAGTQSEMYTAAAADTRKAGNLSMLGSFISGAGSVASKWTEAKSTGALGGSTSDSNQIGIFNNGGGNAPTWATV